MKFLDKHLCFPDSVSFILVNQFIIDQAIDNQLLLLSLWKFKVDYFWEFIDMKFHRLLVFKRIQMNIELVFNKLLNLSKLIVEEVHKYCWVGHHIRISNSRADDEPVEKIFHFWMKVLLFFILHISEIHHFLSL